MTKNLFWGIINLGDFMNLFENEIVNISHLISVSNVQIREEWVESGSTLNSFNNPAHELIFYVTSGSTINYNGKKTKNEPGTIRYIPKGLYKNNCVISDYTAGYYIDVYFNSPDPMPSDIQKVDNVEHLKETFIKLLNIWTSKKPGYYINSMLLFYEIIKKIKNRQAKYFSVQTRKELDIAYEYILENFLSPDFDYKALCKTTNLSYSRFSEKFLSYHHMSPVKFVTNMKINYAKELLMHRHYSISDIAIRCGFKDVYYFSRVFKKTTGVSPNNFRKLL